MRDCCLAFAQVAQDIALAEQGNAVARDRLQSGIDDLGKKGFVLPRRGLYTAKPTKSFYGLWASARWTKQLIKPVKQKPAKKRKKVHASADQANVAQTSASTALTPTPVTEPSTPVTEPPTLSHPTSDADPSPFDSPIQLEIESPPTYIPSTFPARATRYEQRQPAQLSWWDIKLDSYIKAQAITVPSDPEATIGAFKSWYYRMPTITGCRDPSYCEEKFLAVIRLGLAREWIIRADHALQGERTGDLISVELCNKARAMLDGPKLPHRNPDASWAFPLWIRWIDLQRTRSGANLSPPPNLPHPSSSNPGVPTNAASLSSHPPTGPANSPTAPSTLPGAAAIPPPTASTTPPGGPIPRSHVQVFYSGAPYIRNVKLTARISTGGPQSPKRLGGPLSPSSLSSSLTSLTSSASPQGSPRPPSRPRRRKHRLCHKCGPLMGQNHLQHRPQVLHLLPLLHKRPSP